MENIGKKWKNQERTCFWVSPFQIKPINVKFKSRNMNSNELFEEELNNLKRKMKNLENRMDVNIKSGLNWCESEDVCKLLHISKRTLKNYRDSGLIPFSRLRSRYYYRITDINEYLANNINIKAKK
jgi:MerR family transcriptional regulator, repressor of the yfmOP operon